MKLEGPTGGVPAKLGGNGERESLLPDKKLSREHIPGMVLSRIVTLLS